MTSLPTVGVVSMNRLESSLQPCSNSNRTIREIFYKRPTAENATRRQHGKIKKPMKILKECY